MVAVDAVANSGPSADDDERQLALYAQELADGIVQALGPWVERSVTTIHTAWSGGVPDAVAAAARVAGQQAADAVGASVAELLATDVDAQRVNPLQLLRAATIYPTGVLRDAGVPPVVRDSEAERQFPDDHYDLTPASFADVDPALHNAGIAWGAAKAHVILRRRRSQGQR